MYFFYRRVMILLELTVLASGSEVENRIGNPQPLRGSGEQNPRQQMSEMCMPNDLRFYILCCFDDLSN